MLIWGEEHFKNCPPDCDDCAGWYVPGPGDDFALASFTRAELAEVMEELTLSWRPLWKL